MEEEIRAKCWAGGKKKTPKKAEQSDQSMREKCSSEVDAAFEMFERCSRTGIGGWSAKMTEAMLVMDDEQTEEMLIRLRSGFPEEVGNDPEPMIEGISRFLQERRRREKDQHEEAVREAEQQQQRRQAEVAREAEQEQGKRMRFGKEEQSEETPAQSIDEREATNGLEEVRTSRGSAGLARGG